MNGPLWAHKNKISLDNLRNSITDVHNLWICQTLLEEVPHTITIIVSVCIKIIISHNLYLDRTEYVLESSVGKCSMVINLTSTLHSVQYCFKNIYSKESDHETFTTGNVKYHPSPNHNISW